MDISALPVSVASVFSALAGMSGGIWWLALRDAPREAFGTPEMETRRRLKMRKESASFKMLEPLVMPQAEALEQEPGETMPLLGRIGKVLPILGKEHWRATEWLALRRMEAIAAGLLAGLVLGYGGLGYLAGLISGFFVWLKFPEMALRTEEKKAALHRQRVVSRLPFALDLMALMQEAGVGTFQQCIRTVRDEISDTPLGSELALMDARISQGTSQSETMRELAKRMDDNDIENLVLAVNTAEEKGARLKDTLRNLAEQMRLRKVQWMEKSAEQARVHITWPALSVVVGCMVLIVGLVVLNAVMPAPSTSTGQEGSGGMLGGLVAES